MIRPATQADLPRLLEIYDSARAFMRQSGNPTQWNAGYPGQERLLGDIARGQLYCVSHNGRLCACFMLAPGPDPTYKEIFEGQWGFDTPYGVLHRVASDGSCRGILKQCVDFAARTYPHLRIDTHRDNLPMQRALSAEGFICRGIIHTHDGSPRLAYDRMK